MSHKNTLTVLSLLLAFALLCACSSDTPHADNPFSDIPDSVYTFFTDYMEAAKEGYSTVLDWEYFPEEYEWAKTLTAQSNQYVIEYEIEKAECLNDDLYAFVVSVKTNISFDKYVPAAHFVARLNDEFYLIPTVDYIPDALRGNLDLEEYSFEALNEGITPDDPVFYYEEKVDPEDVIGVISLD